MPRDSQPRRTLPYGTWPSPLSAEQAARAGRRRTDLQVRDGFVYLSERRPEEGGRTAIVRCRIDDAPDTPGTDVVAPHRNVRSTAHEYGGACYRVLPGSDGERIVFADHTSRSIVSAPLSTSPDEEAVLVEDPSSGFADFVHDPNRHRIVCAREQNTGVGEPVASIVAFPTEPGGSSAPDQILDVLVDGPERGFDFLTTPRLSPDGKQLAWLGWRHPDMPWDSTELWLADLDDDGRPRDARLVAGGAGESVFQPEWSPDGVLHWVGDADGWWNIHRLEETGPRNLTPMEAEFGLPQWVFGMSTYRIPRHDLLVAIHTSDGVWRLVALDPRRQEPERRDLTPAGNDGPPPFTHFDSVAADQHAAAVLAAGPLRATTVLALDLDAERTDDGSPADTPCRELLRPEPLMESGSVSVGVTIDFPSPDPGARLDPDSPRRTGHAFFYPPTHATVEGPADEAPPLIVKSHGGPTAATGNAFDPGIQFWTSRGFAVVDVNYAGSTGYGRAYRRLLEGRWGVVDVEDCAAAALHLERLGRVDGERLIVRGGSAGGYTTLAALAFTDVFRAGASHYGIGDLEALARDTHKFESRYLDRIIGPYPEQRELYRARSPIHSADRMSCPVIFFQGSEDRIVPPNQSESMVEALRQRGVEARYVLFEGEGHGFRDRLNIVAALEQELAFYRATFSLDA